MSEFDNSRLDDMGLNYRCRDGKTFELASDEELAARLALVRMLDNLLGPSQPGTSLEYSKASIVTDVIGDNRNASAFVHLFHLWKDESALRLLQSGKALRSMEQRVQKEGPQLRSLPR